MKGTLHPLSQFIRLSLDYFERQGFVVVEGFEIETEWFNFDALNVPKTHPSRDVQDTFWTHDGRVLRTHTTASDVRIVLENQLKPPFRLIIPGRCFRNEATDPFHNHTFYQIDGIAVEKGLNMGHLISLLKGYIENIFGSSVRIRVRPHFYPFVEPGMDMDFFLENQGWREVLGAGMAHPVVLQNMKINPNQWQGIMWGLGVDRLMMEYFKIDDIRLPYTGDLRFIKQFK